MGLTAKDLRPIPQTTVATAHRNGRLTVLGETAAPVALRIGDVPQTFLIRPVVIRDFAMPVNLSGPFLHCHGIDQLHSQGALRIGRHIVPLCPNTALDNKPEIATATAFLLNDTVIPALSIAHVTLLVPAIGQHTMPPGDGILEGGRDFAEKSDTVPLSGALVTVDDDGRVRAGILNPNHHDVIVRAGQRYGAFTRACSLKQAEAQPWRIAIVAPTVKGGRGPTVTEKLKAVIRKVQSDAKGVKDEKKEEVDFHRLSRSAQEGWIRKAFAIDECPALETEVDRRRLVELLLRYTDAISLNGEYGHTTLLQHEIHTVPGPPIKCRTKPVNPVMQELLKTQVDDWHDKGVIEPSNSPWSFPLVAAPKKNGTIRWCVDYRRLNAVTKKDSFPLPLIEDNLARLSNSKVFSCIDGAGAFHVIDIKKEDRPKTAFGTPWGLYHFRRMPFGLTNGPASYSRLVQLALHGIPSEVALPYLDDTIIHSPSVEKHFRDLAVVLDAHRRAGLKIQPSKCQLFRRRVDYLGHQVGPEGIRPIPSYVKAVQEWPLPRTKTDARVFLGKVGYYRRFIRGYSAIAAPWTDVTGKDTPEVEKAPIQVTDEMRRSFEALKKKLLEAPILAYPRFGAKEPFILDTDWSHDANAIGATLSQVQDGKERVILYLGKKLNKAQANYPATKGELCAALHFIQALKYYLQYRKFILRTDHQPLKHIHTMEPMDGHVARWLSTLASYDFDVVYREGKKHGNADGLSRAPHVQAMPEAPTVLGGDEEGEKLGLFALETGHCMSRGIG